MSPFDARTAPELIDSAYWFETNDAPLLHHDLALADLAHLLHLSEQDLIPAAPARALIACVLELDHDRAFTYDPQRGDAFTNREAWIEEHAPEYAGFYATGRARREATTIAFRLATRRALLGLAQAAHELEQALLDLAARHDETRMPDYTYLQQAHPTTFAHYLLSFVYPLQRDLHRLRDAFALCNQSPAGIGSTNGSRLAIQRQRLADALGFDRVITHARDAMWQVDAPLDALNAAATLLLHLDQLVQDLQIFNSLEFGFIELPDEFARASVIMPQKKNPYALAFIRGAAGSLIARVNEMYIIARTPSAQMDNRVFAHGAVPRALELATRAVRLMAALCGGLIIHPEQMQRALDAGFTQATDLAQVLAEEWALDSRTAHRIIARSIHELQAAGQSAREITPQVIADAASEIIGRPLQISPAQLEAALDPLTIIATRTGIGGAAPTRVKEMIADCRGELARERAWLDETTRRIEAAETRLIERARQEIAAS